MAKARNDGHLGAERGAQSGTAHEAGAAKARGGEVERGVVDVFADDDGAKNVETIQRGAGSLDAGVPNDAEARRKLFIRMTLIDDYRLNSAFISVPTLARILGMAPSTIWNHMRQKKFPIPYRVFNTTPMVCIDDLVDWYCAKDDLIFPDELPEPRKSARENAEDERERRFAQTDDIVANALASLGISPRPRRRF